MIGYDEGMEIVIQDEHGEEIWRGSGHIIPKGVARCEARILIEYRSSDVVIRCEEVSNHTGDHSGYGDDWGSHMALRWTQ